MLLDDGGAVQDGQSGNIDVSDERSIEIGTATEHFYWVVSIVDPVGNFVTTAFVGTPSIAEGMNPFHVPIIQAVLDLVFLALLFVPRFRNVFLRVEKPSTE